MAEVRRGGGPGLRRLNNLQSQLWGLPISPGAIERAQDPVRP